MAQITKYALITGTRPQIIKSVPILKEVKEVNSLEIIHIFTGQHYDSFLTDIFFQTLEVESPQYHLNVGSGDTEYHIRTIIDRANVILKSKDFKGIIVPGDTNSALAAALTGLFLRIPVLHLESGLRSYDMHMQEEINRRLIDHGSSVLFAPTETAVNNLKNESVLGKIIQCGDTMYDLLLARKRQIFDEELFKRTAESLKINKKEYIVLTAHRRENLLDSTKIEKILGTIGVSGIPTIFPIHPHTKNILSEAKISVPKNIIMINPLSYQDFLNLVANAGLVLTDSGGLQKETYLLGVPSITLRTSTEWVETVQKGANVIVGTNSEFILKEIDQMFNKKFKVDGSVYGDGNATKKIIKELSENIPNIPTVPEI